MKFSSALIAMGALAAEVACVNTTGPDSTRTIIITLTNSNSGQLVTLSGTVTTTTTVAGVAPESTVTGPGIIIVSETYPKTSTPGGALGNTVSAGATAQEPSPTNTDVPAQGSARQLVPSESGLMAISTLALGMLLLA